MSAKYEVLVDRAPELIKVLPWGPDYEVEVFKKPDFTALEVLTFATGGTLPSFNMKLQFQDLTCFRSGIPAGINVGQIELEFKLDMLSRRIRTADSGKLDVHVLVTLLT